MLNNFSYEKKLFLIAGILILILFFAVSLLMFSNRSSSGGIAFLPTPTPIQNGVSTIQKTAIGHTTQAEVENLTSIEKKETLSDGSTRYSLKSPLFSRKNEIVAKDGQVTFERILTPESPSSKGYAKISDYTTRYGQPEETIKGSRFYGPEISTLIYAQKGFTLIANTNTGEVYEIQLFAPMSTESYKSIYGEDINQTGGHAL